MSIQKEQLLHNFFEQNAWHFNRCLAPGMACTSTAIRAHSVQNSRVLDLLVRDGHVKSIVKRVDSKKGPQIFFDDVGRNQASTFAGFCAEHDRQIFGPIDAAAFCSSNPQHLFLVAYRAVARELHTLMEAASRIQSTYLKRIELALDSGNAPEAAGMLAVNHLERAYLTHMYKERFDDLLNSSQCGDLTHDVMKIKHDRATLAVCSLFSIDELNRDGDPVRVALNVLPVDHKESVAVFSYLPEDAPLARSSLSLILASDGFYQKYLLSKLILSHCENFVVSPVLFDTWSSEKHQSIVDYFVATLFEGHLEKENKHLYLF
jgi:hypothetical protein